MSEKKVCIMLNGSVKNDGRVIKIIRTISRWASVDLFYMHGRKEERKLFNSEVRLFSLKSPYPVFGKWMRHSFFYREFDFMAGAVLLTGLRYDVIYCNDLPTLRSGLRVKQKLGARLLYDSHEIIYRNHQSVFPQIGKGSKVL